MMTAPTNIPHVHGCLAAILAMLFLAGSACAQTQSSSLNLQLPQPDLRAEANEDAVAPDEYDADTATSVHGSFTSEIGHSKNYGNSTVNAAELDVNKRYDNGKTLNLHIDVLRSTGLPNVAPRDYVSRYPGY
jgi:hypothetical protein